RGSVQISAGSQGPVDKQVVVGDNLRKISQHRTGPGLWEQFLNPAEPPIDVGHSIRQVTVHYPQRHFYAGSYDVDWLLAFLALTIVFSLILKRPLRVQF